MTMIIHDAIVAEYHYHKVWLKNEPIHVRIFVSILGKCRSG